MNTLDKHQVSKCWHNSFSFTNMFSLIEWLRKQTHPCQQLLKTHAFIQSTLTLTLLDLAVCQKPQVLEDSSHFLFSLNHLQQHWMDAIQLIQFENDDIAAANLVRPPTRTAFVPEATQMSYTIWEPEITVMNDAFSVSSLLNTRTHKCLTNCCWSKFRKRMNQRSWSLWRHITI